MANKVLPTIHLNGTSKDELVRQQLDVVGKLQAALSAMSAASPHSRDYYVRGQESYGPALDQHMDWMKRVWAVMDEVREFAEAIRDGGHQDWGVS